MGFYKGDQHVLNMRLIDHIFDDMLVEEVEVRIILPEGVTNLELSTPYTMTRQEDTLHFTYLDSTGRTVVTLNSNKLLTESHIQDFQLGFSYPHRTMLAEPLILVAGYCEKVASLQDRRASLYHNLEEALLKLKANKDISSFQNTLKRIGGDQKAETAAIAELQTIIKGVNMELGDKVGELQKQDKVFRDLQAQQASLVEKLVSGKMAKQAYIDQEGAIVKKKEDAIERINNIIKSF